MSPDRLREQGVHGATFDLARDEPNPEEDGDEETTQIDRGQTEVLDHLHVLPRGQSAGDRAGDRQSECEQRRTVQHAAAHRFPQYLTGDDRNHAHVASPRPNPGAVAGGVAASSVTLRRK